MIKKDWQEWKEQSNLIGKQVTVMYSKIEEVCGYCRHRQAVIGHYHGILNNINETEIVLYDTTDNVKVFNYRRLIDVKEGFIARRY